MQMVRTMWRFALLVVSGSAAGAVELKQIEFKVGTEGLRQSPLAVTNQGPEPISCTAEYAHWYSSGIGTAEPGRKLEIPLWFETATGTYVMLNARQENLPVESLWCGIAGKAYETRALLPLERKAGANAARRVLACSTAQGRTICGDP